MDGRNGRPFLFFRIWESRYWLLDFKDMYGIFRKTLYSNDKAKCLPWVQLYYTFGVVILLACLSLLQIRA